jgi:hypothetical protein
MEWCVMMAFENTVPTPLVWLGIVVVVAAVGVSFRRHMRPDLGSALLLALRLVFIGLLAWCMFLPQRQDSVTHMQRPRFIVAVDRSGSMATTINPEVANRWAMARRVLRDPWTEELGSRCGMDIYTFSTKIEPQVELGQIVNLSPDGQATSLRASLLELEDRYKGQDVAGLLLLSDGIDTRELGEKWAARRWAWPIYTLSHEPRPPKEPEQESDVRVDAVNTARRVTTGWKTDLKVVISGQGTKGNAVNVQVFRNGKLLQESPAWIPDAGGSKELVFQLDHPETGLFTYDVNVPPLPGEGRTNDNSYAVRVQVVDPRNRLLYVEGPPRWESKFLIRVLQASNRITPFCFTRGADGKFLSIGPSSGIAPDLSEQQMALIKIVVLGNLDAEELGEARARNLVKFVETGGSLVLLGGSKGWGPAGFSRTALGGLLPARNIGDKPAEGKFQVSLTEAGSAHPAFAGDSALWQTIPPVLSVFPVEDLSPGAEALVVADTDRGKRVVMAAQRYGQGKVLALFTDSLWRWQLNPDESRNMPYKRFWDQIIAWLSPAEESVESERIEIIADREQLYLGEAIKISARIEGAAIDINDKATMQCGIVAPDKRRMPFLMTRQPVMTPSGKAFPGFGVEFTAEQPGVHTATAITEIGGRKFESSPVSFLVKSYTAESVPKPPDVGVLQSVARNSGGAFFTTPAELCEALSRLEPRGREETTVVSFSLWQNAWVVACLMLALSLEWIVRKWRNLP